jgi:uncharacterized damage-inducible protein DinB
MDEPKLYDVAPLGGFSSDMGLLIAMLQEGTREWREELGRVGKEAVIWQPFPTGHSIGTLMLHIADVEAYWIEKVAAGRKLDPEEQQLLLSNEINQYGVSWPPSPRKPLSYFLEIQDRIRERTIRTLQELGNPNMTVTWRNGKVVFTLRWIVHHVITHEAYHAGQAVLLNLIYRKFKTARS